MNETATTVERAAPVQTGTRTEARELDRRLFFGTVAACTTAVGVFLLVQLSGWPPHEDETLPLFVGRQPLGDLFDIVLGRRGGAPVHFLLAWVVAHLGGGLYAMRFLSALFATASLPAIAVLGNRLAGRRAALAGTALGAASWLLLFHGIYARMYSLFLLLSTLSYLALLRALDRGGARAWTLWAVTMLLCIGTHPYGALVLGSQGLYVLATRGRLRQAVPAFAAVLVLAIPFWRSSIVLADRFDVGVGGGGGGALSTPGEVLRYLWRVAGDSSTGYTGVLVLVLLLAGFGLAQLSRERPQSAVLATCVVLTPTLFFLAGRFGGNSAPESRHLIFVLPFFVLAAGAGIVTTTGAIGPRGAWLAAIVVAALLPVEVAWGWHKTPALFKRENPVRVSARHKAADWLAATSRPDDVLFAYEPLYLAAWERGGSTVSRTIVPRADPKLALQTLRETRPLGRGVWVFDAGDNNNYVKRTRIELRLPFPHSEFEGRVYGPYLVIRTRRPTVTVDHYLDDARKVELIGKSLGMGDADINYATIRRVQVRLAVLSRSKVSS
ncbi:MAG TPA: glycosyltransferase family 39 protein [Gaiellaceae bacterium]